MIIYKKLAYYDYLQLDTFLFTLISRFVNNLEELNLDIDESLENYNTDYISILCNKLKIEMWFFPLKHWKNLWDFSVIDYNKIFKKDVGIEYRFQCP
jgi:hypothetical protein